MLIALVSAALFCVLAGPVDAAGTQTDQAPAENAKKTKASKPKDRAKGDTPSKPKKSKKATADVPAPDEPIDPDAIESGGRGWRFSWKQHPSLRYGTIFRMDGEAKFQEDAHGSYPNAPNLTCPNQALPTPCTWELHRNRVGIQGHLFKHIEYEVERELTEQELSEKDILLGYTPKSVWKDVNVNLTYIKNAQIQIGKFKVPFGLDELTGVSHNDFVYRSLGANYLAPARDIGGMVHGRFFKHGLNYWVGVFQHDGDNARSKKIQGGDETVAARVTGTPFRRFTRGPIASMELGSAFAISSLSDDSFRPNGLRGRTALTQDTFYESVYVKGHRRRWEADADWSVGRASARAEYTWVSDDRIGQGIGNEDLPDARARSWYVSGSWILTGEKKKRPVKPAADFLQGGWGAVEVVGRYEHLWFDSDGSPANAYRNPRAEVIVPSGDKALTIGANWTLNRFVKLQINAIREHVDDADRNPVPNTDAFWSRVFRLQFVL